ncbi:ribose 5-phosphate isomerase A [Patulibacter defluvii]|uniref:ribose 5-phosphate isomerase A n=1 Tax=Patulibacter defluvii TaxID=3095358 RepID=UPI002A76694B|nr:ribose 5-phosphate isomerase A [Patulibacter sp. DM4]
MSGAGDRRQRGKRTAARAAAAMVAPRSRVGLGTGSTVAELLPALAERDLDLRCVATSPATADAARDLGLAVEPFTALDRLDVAIDGADQVAPDGWLVKGGGGAHLRERIVAAAADRFLVIVDDGKLVERLHGPLPLELRPFGLAATLRRLPEAVVRDAPPSPDGGVIADLGPAAEIADPAALAARLAATPGVADHGLFPPTLVAEVLVGAGDDLRRWTPSRGAQGPYRG